MAGQPEFEHEHERVPMEVATGRILDITRMDLGNPDDPGMWQRLHRNCRVGVLVCADCADDSPKRYLYVQERNGKRLVAGYNYEQVRAAGFGETDEHFALKDRVCVLAEREGLQATQEVSGPARKRRTDVVVRGGEKPVGWEIQLSPIQRPQLSRRIRVARGDGLVPSWLTMRGAPAFRDLINRAPACSAKQMTHSEITAADDLLVFQGLKNLAVVRCSDQRSRVWHRGLRCTGRHLQPAGLEDAQHPTLARMISLSASGDVVPIRWPHDLQLGYRRPWLWVSKEDADRFQEVERPLLDRLGMSEPPADARSTADSAGWHVSVTKAINPDAREYDGTGLAAILGGQCRSCGHTRGRHRPGAACGNN